MVATYISLSSADVRLEQLNTRTTCVLRSVVGLPDNLHMIGHIGCAPE